MSYRCLILPAALVTGAIAAPGAAASAETFVPPNVAANANGNLFTGGLSFTPADITIPVGGLIAWRNTDFVAPHTVTERHGLWNLTGGWGATPINPAGFGPQTIATRKFEAGTQAYFCIVHPKQMTGTISVPVTASVKRAKRTRAAARDPRLLPKSLVTVTWAADPPAGGEGFDFERRATSGGKWTRIANATTAQGTRFRVRRGRSYELRARLRSLANENQATGWSPVVSITG